MFALALTAAADNGWGGKLPIIPHPAELIIGLVFFGVAYWAVAKFVVPRFEEAFAERTAVIEGGIARAEAAQEEATAALAEYRAQLAGARAEASRMREEARQEGAAIIAEMRVRAQEEADRITASAQAHIQAERQAAVVQLRIEVGRLATDLASRIVEEALQDEARQSRVVERFLAELEGAPVPAGSAAAEGA